jgi:uncharacterized protein (TIGR02266 family)
MASAGTRAVKTVLVADDTAFVRDRFRDALEGAGHQTVDARTGSELLAGIQKTTPRIDLMLLDLHLSGGRGVDLVRRIRAVAQDRPIVVFSGTIASTQEVAELALLGVSGYINEYTGAQHIVRALAPHLFPDEHNRRSSPRVAFNAQVSYRVGNLIATVLSLNVSTGGLAVRTANPLEVGTVVKLRFRLPKSGETLEIEARVAWAEPRLGMGLQFTQIDAAQRTTLDTFVSSHFFSNRKA